MHQYLDLKSEFRYSTNAKRLIKKANEKFHYKRSHKAEELIELFRETAFKKIDSITNEDLNRLENLMYVALEKEKGELYLIYSHHDVVGGGFFLKDKKRITYLKGASTEEAKKSGAMFGLIDHAIKHYRDHYNTFDFGGSDVENVANFYKKFGATDRVYYNYSIDNLPLWFKTLKKIRK